MCAPCWVLCAVQCRGTGWHPIASAAPSVHQKIALTRSYCVADVITGRSSRTLPSLHLVASRCNARGKAHQMRQARSLALH